MLLRRKLLLMQKTEKFIMPILQYITDTVLKSITKWDYFGTKLVLQIRFKWHMLWNTEYELNLYFWGIS